MPSKFDPKKAYPAEYAKDQRAVVKKHFRGPIHPINDEDIGELDFRCVKCGYLFVEKATAEYIRSLGNWFCTGCGVWTAPAKE